RDFHVTGVQTCALPIWYSHSGAEMWIVAFGNDSAPSEPTSPPMWSPWEWEMKMSVTLVGSMLACFIDSSSLPFPSPMLAPAPARSEERRVGTESRPRYA